MTKDIDIGSAPLRLGTITPAQAKEARQMLGWGIRSVCRKLAITPHTLERAESTKSTGNLPDRLANRLRALYEAAGVDFDAIISKKADEREVLP